MAQEAGLVTDSEGRKLRSMIFVEKNPPPRSFKEMMTTPGGVKQGE